MNRAIVGIDPGKSGGIAYICNWESEPEVVKFSDRTEKDICILINSIAVNRSTTTSLKCYIENVHTMPKQGIVSAGKFMRNFGLLIGALYCSGIPFEFVSPQKWQKALGCMSRGDKNVTKSKAQQLFPTLKITHAIADALLIAEYGRRQEDRTLLSADDL